MSLKQFINEIKENKFSETIQLTKEQMEEQRKQAIQQIYLQRAARGISDPRIQAAGKRRQCECCERIMQALKDRKL